MQKIKKTPFLKAISAVCVSREIFSDLKAQSVWRTLLHFVFIAFLCSCFIMLAGHKYMLEKISRPLDSFEEKIGSIIHENGAFYPSKDRNKPFEEELTPDMKLVYSPDLNSFDTQWVSRKGMTILWFPRLICYINTVDGNTTMNIASVYADSNVYNTKEIKDSDELMDYLADLCEEAEEKKPENTNSDNLTVTRQSIEFTYLTILFLYYWFEFGIQTFILVLLFSFFYHFIGSKNNSVLGFKEVFVTGFYAAVPPMMIAAAFPALDLPYFNFEIVLLAGFAIYFIAVLNYLERSGSAEIESQEGEN